VTADQVIRVERRIDAPPHAVFRYLTESELWSRWQGATAELEPEPGGRFRVAVSDDQVVEGTFVAIEPDVRITVTWGWRGHPRMPPGTTTVDFELVPDGPGTIVRLTHSGLPPEDIPIHRQGWDVYLPRLEVAATGGDPGPTPL
jgi:uncharacterized protein YndB with AHSA1/START domain